MASRFRWDGFGRRARVHSGNTRIGRTHPDPGFETCDLIVGEFLALGRHLQVLVGVTDRLDQKALFRMRRHDCGSGIAAFQQTLTRVQQQTAANLLRALAVALVTIVRQDWPDVFLKELHTVWICRFAARRICRQQSAPDQTRPNYSRAVQLWGQYGMAERGNQSRFPYSTMRGAIGEPIR